MNGNRLNCIIVEDEPLAAEILKDYIAELPALHLVAHCSDAIMALDILKSYKIDLVFLDIHLPKLKGFEFLNTLENRPDVIITSAFHEYALKGFEYNVVDYLLKPVEFTRFLLAVNKVLGRQKPQQPQQIVQHILPERKFMFFNVGKKNIRIFLDEINYVESVREYVKVFYNTKFIITKIKIGDMEQLLPPSHFIRIHRSFIVNLSRIESFSHFEIEVAGKQLPVSRSCKEKLHQIMQAYK
ncbi:MAG: response regulator transcription factor [Ferruginibacter sp.]